MGLFDTNAEKVAAERLTEARKGVKSLQNWLNEVDEAMERHEHGAFPISWCTIMMEKALAISQ